VFQFPIGIDPERFIQALETEPVKLHIEELRKFFNGRKVHSYTYVSYLG
jgi:trehalose 6-phosphate synthase/phosphatase